MKGVDAESPIRLERRAWRHDGFIPQAESDSRHQEGAHSWPSVF
jgi:hypothetical protein